MKVLQRQPYEMSHDLQESDAILLLEQLLYLQQQQQLQDLSAPQSAAAFEQQTPRRTSDNAQLHSNSMPLLEHHTASSNPWAAANLASAGLSLDQAMQYLALCEQQRLQERQEGQQRHYTVHAAAVEQYSSNGTATAQYFAEPDEPPGLGSFSNHSFSTTQTTFAHGGGRGEPAGAHTSDLWSSDLLLAANGLPSVSAHDLDLAMGYLSLASPEQSAHHSASLFAEQQQQQQQVGVDGQNPYAYHAPPTGDLSKVPQQYPYEQFDADETMANRPSPFIHARGLLPTSDPIHPRGSSAASGQLSHGGGGGVLGGLSGSGASHHLLRRPQEPATRNSSQSSRTSGFLGLSSASLCRTDSITTRESSRSSRHSGPNSGVMQLGVSSGAGFGGQQQLQQGLSGIAGMGIQQYHHQQCGSARRSHDSGELPRLPEMSAPPDTLGLVSFQGLRRPHEGYNGGVGHVPGASAWPVMQENGGVPQMQPQFPQQQRGGFAYVTGKLWSQALEHDAGQLSRPSSDDTSLPSSYAHQQQQQQWPQTPEMPRLGHSTSLPVRLTAEQVSKSIVARPDPSARSAPPAAAGWNPLLAPASPSAAASIHSARQGQAGDWQKQQGVKAGPLALQQQQLLTHTQSAPAGSTTAAAAAAATAEAGGVTHHGHSASAPSVSAAGDLDQPADTSGSEALPVQAPVKSGRTRVRRRKKVPIITQLPAWADADWTPHASVVLSATAGGGSANAGTGVFLRRGSSGSTAASTAIHVSAPLPSLKELSPEARLAARTSASTCSGRLPPSLYAHSALPLGFPSGENVEEASFAGLVDFQGTASLLSGSSSPARVRSPENSKTFLGDLPESVDPFRPSVRQPSSGSTPPALEDGCSLLQQQWQQRCNSGLASDGAGCSSAMDAWMARCS